LIFTYIDGVDLLDVAMGTGRQSIYPTFIISVLLVAREVLEVLCVGLIAWMKMAQHWLDTIIYSVLLLICIVQTGINAEGVQTETNRNITLVTGGLAWIMPILSLRVIHLSFALFVSGIINVRFY
jgi:hypothetical protein